MQGEGGRRFRNGTEAGCSHPGTTSLARQVCDSSGRSVRLSLSAGPSRLREPSRSLRQAHSKARSRAGIWDAVNLPWVAAIPARRRAYLVSGRFLGDLLGDRPALRGIVAQGALWGLRTSWRLMPCGQVEEWPQIANKVCISAPLKLGKTGRF